MKHTKKFAAIFCSVLLISMVASFTVFADSKPVDLNQNQYTNYSFWTNTISHQSKFSGVNSSSSNHYVYFTAQYYDAVAKQGFDDNYFMPLIMALTFPLNILLSVLGFINGD